MYWVIMPHEKLSIRKEFEKIMGQSIKYDVSVKKKQNVKLY